jgi:hypothetical protein
MRKLVGVLLAIVELMLCAAAAAAMPAGTVVVVTGSCTDHGRVLKRSDVVQTGDTVAVPAGGDLELQMVDGSIISVGPDSIMTVATYEVGGSGADVQLSLTQGVLHVTSVTRPFEVSTRVGTAAVDSDSADWVVKVQGGSVQVGVLAGTVNLTSTATEQSVSIPAHWGTRIESGFAPVLPRVWTQTEFNAVIRLTNCCQYIQPK